MADSPEDTGPPETVSMDLVMAQLGPTRLSITITGRLGYKDNWRADLMVAVEAALRDRLERMGDAN